MGRIPNFTYRIFPTQSISYLNLLANVGLILFLFLIGLEVDVGVMKKNGRNSAIISVAGMVLPFGLGAAIAVPIYNTYVDHSVTSFGHFLLFVGVAMSITAFPVLCRILTSTNLLDDKVGVIVLAAGVGNDVVGWVLLALTLALVNADAGVSAVYILLCAVGWSAILLFPIRWGFIWLCRRSGSLDHGPTPGMMTVTLLIVFASSFVTGIIGGSNDLVGAKSRCSSHLWCFPRRSYRPTRRRFRHCFCGEDRRLNHRPLYPHLLCALWSGYQPRTSR